VDWGANAKPHDGLVSDQLPASGADRETRQTGERPRAELDVGDEAWAAGYDSRARAMRGKAGLPSVLTRL
jgi:hypothetical protein